MWRITRDDTSKFKNDAEFLLRIAEKVIRKGSTPAGMHISIMVKEILEVLKIKPGEKGLDTTSALPDAMAPGGR